MPMTIEGLAVVLVPPNTTLVLGAGASVPSGAPSGTALAERLWKNVARQEPQSDDLTETATILERRFGRRNVIEEVRAALQPLQPTGGLLALPNFGWLDIFTTNFDLLLEIAYKRNKKKLSTIRSNYDLTYNENRQEATLYKIHGCISQDRSLGDKSSMIITEDDYTDFSKYRQSLFSLLTTRLLTGNVLVIGQRLRDRHLQDLVKNILAAKQEGAPGQVFVLIYDKDDLRAPLLEDKGARIAFAGIDEFVHTLAEGLPEKVQPPKTMEDGYLGAALSPTVLEICNKGIVATDVVRMFNGGAANYSDIREGGTFERAAFSSAMSYIQSTIPAIAIIGAAGVGKTTLARQIAVQLADNHGYLAWEHRNEFAFRDEYWRHIESVLRENDKRGLLILDECTRFLRSVNNLVDYLAQTENTTFRLLLTANSALWAPRLKSPMIYARGKIIELSQLQDPELNALINLVEYNKKIADLVQSEFRKLNRSRQFEGLKRKCSADMFVCLKNIFANESLDTILLREYSEIEDAYQEYYRYVAGLEAVGTRVHRQLLIRMLGIRADQTSHILTALTGIVDEYDIKPDQGLFGWSTRHLVIARRIMEYKFSHIDDIIAMFERIIDHINPAIPLEL